MQVVYGIDIGGTQVKARAFRRDGKVLASHSMPLGEGKNGPERVRESVRMLYEKCNYAPDGLGLAAPGLASRSEDRIVCLPGGKVGIEGLRWAEFLEFTNPLKVLNDAHAGLLGEWWQGAARGLRDAVLVTLGTGVGGAILSEGRLLRGHQGRAGHIGHISLDPEGVPGICGMPGSLDDIMGNQTISARSNGRFTSTAELVAAVEAGDDSAKQLWERSVYLLACGLGSIINILDPEAIIVGGGIALAGESLFIPLQAALDRVEWRPLNKRVRLIQAGLGEWSGTYGAAYRVMDSITG